LFPVIPIRIPSRQSLTFALLSTPADVSGERTSENKAA
jgi:hypothetical protein